jgi:hypothetical protein
LLRGFSAINASVTGLAFRQLTYGPSIGTTDPVMWGVQSEGTNLQFLEFDALKTGSAMAIDVINVPNSELPTTEQAGTNFSPTRSRALAWDPTTQTFTVGFSQSLSNGQWVANHTYFFINCSLSGSTITPKTWGGIDAAPAIPGNSGSLFLPQGITYNEASGQLYGADLNEPSIYSIDKTTISGSLTGAPTTYSSYKLLTGSFIAPSNSGYNPPGNTGNSAIANGKLYALDYTRSNNVQLLSYQLSGGAINDIADVGQPWSSISGTAIPNGMAIVAPFSVWGLSSGGTFNIGSNWLNNEIPSGQAAHAFFLNAAGGVITLDGNQTVGQMTLNSTGSYTIAQGTGSGVLTIDDSPDPNGPLPAINVVNGTHSITAPMSLVNGVSVNFQNGSSLTLGGTISGYGTMSVNGPGKLTVSTTGVLNSASGLAITTGATVALAASSQPLEAPAVQTVASLSFDATPGSKLDITNNEIIVTGTNETAIRADIVAGALYSSLSNLVYGVGEIPDGSGTEIRYTVLGDTNLDGMVNFTDLLTLATNYGSTNADWAMGDFNYDGTVNFTDLLALATNYSVSLTPGESESAGISPGFAADWNLAVSEAAAAVPEPTSLGLLALAATRLLTRRRRSN